ncbi:MAG: NF038104 family lipoprotein [Aestuariibacter sp.]
MTINKRVSMLVMLALTLPLSGCVAVSVVSTAVGATVAVVEGTVEVVDAVTPDVFSDDEDDDNEEEENEE